MSWNYGNFVDGSDMHIKKIISGAQTGADRAALDFAIEYDIEHGGWVPKGRRAEDGIIAPKYRVWELPEGGYAKRTEKNVLEADGTLIFSHGELTGGSLLTWQLAQKYARPCLHIDACNIFSFDAAIDIYEWLGGHRIGILNVAGPRASKDSKIYTTTYNILETVFHINIIDNAMPDIMDRSRDQDHRRVSSIAELPRNVEKAVDDLMNRLTGGEKTRIASMEESELHDLAKTWGKFIRTQFSLNLDNQELIADCRSRSGDSSLDAESAAMLILHKFWVKLRKIGHLRVIK